MANPKSHSEILDGSTDLASHRSAHFIRIELSNEDQYFILRIMYCYSLQQRILLEFCIDFDTHYGMLVCILLPEKTSEPRTAENGMCWLVNIEEGNFSNFENSNKINEKSYNDNFSAVVIRRKGNLYCEKNWG